MKHIYTTFSIDASYSKLEATRKFIKQSKGLSNESYEALLEQYIILIDKDVRILYLKMNPQKRFTHLGELDDFLNKHKTYIKMKSLIDEKLGFCNRNNPLSVVFTLLRKELSPFN